MNESFSFCNESLCVFFACGFQNLTEYNTALNRRIASMGMPENEMNKFRKRKVSTVQFDDEEHIINPG